MARQRGKNEIWTRAQMVAFIDRGGEAYTKDNAGHRAEVLVRDPLNGPRYLQTKADGVWTDNLLTLTK